jgi:hypothetical protein
VRAWWGGPAAASGGNPERTGAALPVAEAFKLAERMFGGLLGRG